MSTTNPSLIVTFRRDQQLREEAAQRALYASAIVANHETITKRMEQGATHILHLIEQGKHTEAVALMQQADWGMTANDTESEIAHG